MTPAAELHAAAAKLRQRAEKASPGPWSPDESVDNSADAAYIATMHPGVGLLLADLLDRLAEMSASAPGWKPGPMLERGLAVARAILGTDQRHSAQPGTDAAPSTSGTVAT